MSGVSDEDFVIEATSKPSETALSLRTTAASRSVVPKLRSATPQRS